MSKNYLLWDIRAVARGIETVITATLDHSRVNYLKSWQNSSIRLTINDCNSNISQRINHVNTEQLLRSASEGLQRASMVYYGIREFAIAKAAHDLKVFQTGNKPPPITKEKLSYEDQFSSERPKGLTEEDLKITELAERDKELIRKLEQEHEEKILKDTSTKSQIIAPISSQPPISPQPPILQQTLNPEARQRKVPATRISRLLSFGSLAAGLGFGTIAEFSRRTIAPRQTNEELSLDRLFLTEANAERIVATLCKVRGAALKIGQILSIQDNTIISPGLQRAFERVRQSADFMPTWQVHKMLARELGTDWRAKMLSFEEKPFAAASIGQVHLIQLHDKRYAAMKIQYPGVAAGINSDIDNLMAVLKVWNIFPKGLFIDNLVEVAKRELAWEVDYNREKNCTKEFQRLLMPYADYVVPNVIDELSTQYVFTSELVSGIPVDKCVQLSEKSRIHVARLIMNLCLLELFEFRYMQTDPNWSNFFYNEETGKLALLDFGASREYSKSFMDNYIEVIKGASDKDREKVLVLSRKMGFLTGYESKAMEAAHVDAVMVLGEVLTSEKPFDFGNQDTTRRIQKLIPTIVAERLCPPPEEIYSLHRKLSGVFLLCAKLRVKMSCYDLFQNVYQKYQHNK